MSMTAMPTTVISMTLSERFLGASSMDTNSLDLDLAFGAVDSKVELRDRKVHYEATP